MGDAPLQGRCREKSNCQQQRRLRAQAHMRAAVPARRWQHAYSMQSLAARLHESLALCLPAAAAAAAARRSKL